jgi:hypothetical protein
MVKTEMKKIIAIGLICLVAFVSLAALSNNPTFSAIQNQNSQVRVQLTHQAQRIYQATFFNQTNSQYLDIEGNDTLSLIANGTTQDYLGLYSFTCEVNGTHPIDWTITETGNATVEVIENRTDHHKVVELYSEAGTYYAVMKNTFADIGVNKVELWVYSNSNGDNIQIEILHGVTQVIYIEFDWGMSLVYTWSGGSFENLQAITTERWYHTRIDFSSTSDDYDVYIDGILKGVDRAYITTVDHLDTMQITGVGETYGNATAYIDAVDYGWADDYYVGRNNDTGGIHEADGSFISPILDLGAANNYFITHINLTYTTPDDSELAGAAQFSEDNVIWSGWLPFSGLPNVTVGFECGRYFQFYINMTASSDTFDTPELDSLLVQFEETVLNELPQLGTIQVAFDNETLEAMISVYVTDPDNDTMDIFLCLPLGDIIANQTTVINGTIVQFIVICEYDSAYEYYLNVTDSEDSTQSSLFGFSVKAPEVPTARTAGITDYLIVIFGLCLVVMIGTANIPKRK